MFVFQKIRFQTLNFFKVVREFRFENVTCRKPVLQLLPLKLEFEKFVQGTLGSSQLHRILRIAIKLSLL